jgi:hypothetical protein
MAGKYMREATSLTFNRIFGEYLHFCYFFFYVILAGTYLLAWALCPREHFDRLATAEVLTYMVCLSFYLVMPAVGPYWAYPDSVCARQKAAWHRMAWHGMTDDTT